MQRLRAAAILASFLAFTLPLMPLQWALLKARSRHARTLPHWYHRRVCRLLGIRIHASGAIDPARATLVIANHVSWLDIPVLSAVAPVSFVAKREVGGWPFIGALARLQRSVFVDRTRRTDTGRQSNEIAERLAEGEAIVLFAEGTSSDGNRVLPFKSSLLAAASAGAGSNGAAPPVLQTLTIAYTHIHGLPLGRHHRPLVAWYGDMEAAGHAWELLKTGPVDVHVAIGEALPPELAADRKALARASEAAVRTGMARLLRQGGRTQEDCP